MQSSQEVGPFCPSTSGASFRCVCVIELHRLVVKCRAEFVQETSSSMWPATFVISGKCCLEAEEDIHIVSGDPNLSRQGADQSQGGP